MGAAAKGKRWATASQLAGIRWPLRTTVTVVPPALTVLRITVKGQTTVPAVIRAFVDAEPGTRLIWSAMPDGTIIVRANTNCVLDMAGLLKAPKCKHVSIDDMDPWR